MLQHHDDLFLTEISQLPETLTQIGMQSFTELRKVCQHTHVRSPSICSLIFSLDLPLSDMEIGEIAETEHPVIVW